MATTIAECWHMEYDSGTKFAPLPRPLNEWIEALLACNVLDAFPVVHHHKTYLGSPLRSKAFNDELDHETYVVGFKLVKEEKKTCAVPIELHFSNILETKIVKLCKKEVASQDSPTAQSVYSVLVNTNVLTKYPPVFSTLHAHRKDLIKAPPIKAGEVVAGESELTLIHQLLSDFQEADGDYTWLPAQSVFNFCQKYTISTDLHQLLFVVFGGAATPPVCLQKIHDAFKHLSGYNSHWVELKCMSAANDAVFNANVLPSMAYAFECCILRLVLKCVFSIDDAVRAKGPIDAFVFLNERVLFSFAHSHHIIMTIPELDNLKKAYESGGASKVILQQYILPFIAPAVLETKNGHQLYNQFMATKPDKTILLAQQFADISRKLASLSTHSSSSSAPSPKQ